MNNCVAGYVEDPDAMDSCIGIEFDHDRNEAVAYINEEEISLTYRQVRQLISLASRVASQMEWHNATYVYARYTDKYHLMEKGKHGEHAKTLCGALPPSWGEYQSSWTLTPMVGEPFGTSDHCKRCLNIYHKKQEASA